MSATHEPQGRVALVTGASAGIGREAALALARAGFRTFATARREAPLAELARQAEGLPLETLLLDVDDAGSIERARVEVEARTGGAGRRRAGQQRGLRAGGAGRGPA